MRALQILALVTRSKQHGEHNGPARVAARQLADSPYSANPSLADAGGLSRNSKRQS
jgi:hypothetical protein